MEYTLDIQAHRNWGSVFGPLIYLSNTKPEELLAWMSRNTRQKTKMTREKQPFEDAFPIKNGGFSIETTY